MSKNILFISEQTIKGSSFLSDNVDPKQLLPTVKAVQDRYILPLVGSKLYKKLQELVEGGSVNDPYKTLLDDFIRDTLLWYTLAHLPWPLMFKYLNKGVMQRTAETAQQPSFSDAQAMASWCRDFAEGYAQAAINHLRANASTYPEYNQPDCSVDGVRPDATQYDCGIYLDSRPVIKDARFNTQNNGI